MTDEPIHIVCEPQDFVRASFLAGLGAGIALLNLAHIFTEPGILLPPIVGLLFAAVSLYVLYRQRGGA